MSGPGGAGRIVERVTRWMALAAGGAIVLLMLLTVVDVTLRYVFGKPVFGGQDLAELLLLATFAGSLAWCGRTGGHVSVDLLGEIAGPRITRWTDALVRLISIATLSLVTWRCWVNGLDAAEYGEASTLLEIPYLPFYLLLAAGFALYGLVVLVELVDAVRGRQTDSSP